jgi:Tir chaperone protein (CesT) family
MDMGGILHELGQRLKLGPLELDEFGLCQLVFDKELAVDIQVLRGEEAVFLTASVCPMPDADREAFFRTLLEANLLGQGTGNGYLAIDPAFEEVVLLRRLEPEHLDVSRLEHELQLFVDVLAAWRGRMQGSQAPADGDRAEGEVRQADSLIRV